ncbi:MAG: phosphatase PAP2 family protein [Trueperaceae bacterium]
MEFIGFLQSFASPFLDSLMLLITNLGSEQVYIALLIAVFLGVDASIGRRLGIFLLISFYLNQHLKILMDTPRPFILDPTIARSQAAIDSAGGGAFPSGHAQGSTTFWGLAAFYFRRRWLWILAVTMIALVSLSRLYLGVHWVIDIVGGIVIGIAIIGLTMLVDTFVTNALRIPWWVTLLLGLAIPLVLNIFAPTPESGLLTGAFAAYITAPLLLEHRAPKLLWKRVVLALLGVVLVFGFLIGSSVLLPEEFKRDPIGSFVRYLVLGYVGLLLTPWLGRLFGLAEKGKLTANTSS